MFIVHPWSSTSVCLKCMDSEIIDDQQCVRKFLFIFSVAQKLWDGFSAWLVEQRFTNPSKEGDSVASEDASDNVVGWNP